MDRDTDIRIGSIIEVRTGSWLEKPDEYGNYNRDEHGEILNIKTEYATVSQIISSGDLWAEYHSGLGEEGARDALERRLFHCGNLIKFTGHESRMAMCTTIESDWVLRVATY